MFKIYSSSAGSGKTYTLTKEYLKLALRDRAELGKSFEAHQFKHVLAVTFTNAAANEMKERILKELQKIAFDESSPFPNPTNALFATLVDELQLDAKLVQARARQTFHSILHDYSAFAVLTIDSFVQRVVTAFTDDLELPYSFEVEMDTDAVLQTAIDRILEKVGLEDHRYLSEALEEFYLENSTDGKSWYALAGKLADFSKGQLNDRNYEAVQKLNDLDPSHFRIIRRNLRNHLQQIGQSIQQIAQEGYDLIQRAGISDRSFYYGERGGVGAYFRKRALTADYPEDPNSYVRKAIDDDVWHSGKKTLTPDQLQIDAIKDQLRAYIEQIEQLRHQNQQRYRTFEAIEQHLQKVALLKQIKQECDDLLREQNRIHISEFNRLILKVVTDEPVPFIYERLGEKFHHILIDEFQDTSRLQFVNLLPLLDNNLAYQRFNLAVGDAKQAIYRFRGGDMDQIVALHTRNLTSLLTTHEASEVTTERLSGLERYLQPDRLTTNWRSAESIVQFNNQFFQFLADYYADTEFRQVTEVFDQEFRQIPSKAGIPGHVQLDFIPKPDARHTTPDEPDFTQLMVERTLQYIQTAITDSYSYGDIAVLCRFKKNARLLADFLEANDIPLTSEDSLTLQSSDRVRFLVSVLQLLHQPENRLVRYDMLFLYHRIILQQAPQEALMAFMDDMAKAEDVEQLFSHLSKIDKEPLDPETLQQLSVYELAEKLADYFELFDNERESAYLFRFLDEVLTYSSRYSSHLADFLAYWQTAQEKISVSSPTDRNAVTIQTIHKSKGLEYPVVIIPFADWSFKPRNGDTMWAELESLSELEELSVPTVSADQPGPARRLLTTSVTIQKGLDETPLSAQYQTELYRNFVECVNLVYVAFTRPTDRLYILAARQDYSEAKTGENQGKAKNATGIDYWLYTYLNDLRGNPCWSADQDCYPLYEYVTQPKADKNKLAVRVPLPVALGNREGTQPLRLRRMERVLASESVERSREWIRKVCTALSLVQAADRLEPTLRRLIAEGKLRASEETAMRAQLTQLLAHPQLEPFFAPTVRAELNRPILVRDRSGRGGQRNGPNRTVFLPDRVVLLTYLTEPADEAQEATMQYYLKLYRQMGHPVVEGLLAFLEGPEITTVTA